MSTLDRLRHLVDSGIVESKHLSWSDLRDHLLGKEGYKEFTLIILRGWLRSYTEEFRRLLAQLPSDSLTEGASLVDSFFSMTIMNGLLDWYDVTYVFRPELSLLVQDMKKRGMATRRIDANWPHCTKRWKSMDAGVAERLDQTQLDSLLTVSALYNAEQCLAPDVRSS